MKKVQCQECKVETRRKLLGKIRGVSLCRECRIKKREEHRKETMKLLRTEEDIGATKNKKHRETRRSKRGDKKPKDISPPRPKGSIYKKPKEQNNCYLTKEEKQGLFRILIKRGLDREQADTRIKDLIKSQSELRKNLKNKKKSEYEIKVKQQELLERLWCN